MNIILKYIISDQNIPILFNTNISHSDLLVNIFSAGFVIVNYDNDENIFFAKCYGESSTLKIASNKNDYLLIESFFNNKL